MEGMVPEFSSQGVEPQPTLHLQDKVRRPQSDLVRVR